MTIKTLENFDRNQIVYLKQVYSDPLIRMKKYDEAYTSVGPALDQNGRPVTGLTEDTLVPSAEGTKPIIIPGTRKYMEKELDLEEGALKQSSAFWIAYNVKIGAHPIQLDLTDGWDLLKYLFMCAQSITAVGLSEIQKSSKVEYVIYSEEQEAATRVKGRRSLKEAYRTAEKMDLNTKVEILNIYGIVVDAANVNTIEDKLDEQIEDNPDKFLKLIQDSFLSQKSLVVKCLDKGILRMENGAIYNGDVVVGHTKELAAKAIAADSMLEKILRAKYSGNQELVEKIIKESKVKK